MLLHTFYQLEFTRVNRTTPIKSEELDKPEKESCFMRALALASCTLSITAFHASRRTH